MTQRWDSLLLDCRLATMSANGTPYGAIERAALGWRDCTITFAAPMDELPGPPETLARIPDILKELVEAEGGKAARAGFDSFGASSLDFALLVDVPGRDWTVAHPLRDRLLVAIMKRFAAEGISIPYPTQTTFTAAPDGTIIMPYPEGTKRP